MKIKSKPRVPLPVLAQKLEHVAAALPQQVQQGYLNKYYPYLLLLARTVARFVGENGPLSETRILDVGAGPGILPQCFATLGCRVAAVDKWTEYQSTYGNWAGTETEITSRLTSAGVDWRRTNIEVDPLPFQTAEFDIVLFLDVIEHLTRPHHALSEIRRVLKPNGTLILATPNVAALKNRLKLLCGLSPYPRLDSWFTREAYFAHIREYTLAELQTMLRQTGYKTQDSAFSESLSLPTPSNTRPGAFHRTLRLTSPAQFLKLAYILIVTALPPLRYSIVVVSKASET